VKFVVVVNEPFALVIVTVPVVAPAGTVAVTDRTEVDLTLGEATPLKVTDVAPNR
jgi:hypothetical protein